MTSRWPVRRPTESAAIRAAGRSARPLPSVPAVMAALIDALRTEDRHGANRAAHLVVRIAEGVDE